ncbi:hypothetical protein MKX01_014809 [Papaver californicum]|nr:hypothetical protein MKX01_014809 [Papaver californicum]
MKSQDDFRINNNIVISNCIEDEDEDVCRICINPGDSENPLRYPCACNGSIKYVHQDCLLQWLNYSNARHCEVCRCPFSFSHPVYALEEDEDPVPLDDLVGMQLGPIIHLTKFAFAVLASNMNILGAVIILPFSLGRIVLHFVCWFSTATATPMFLMCSIACLSAVTNSLSETAGLDIVSYCVGKPLVDSRSRLSDATLLATGYMFIVSMVFLYLGTVAIVSYVKGEVVITGKLYSMITYIADVITSLVRQYVTTMRHFVSMVRVAFLLLVELGFLPLICGWWLDACTFRMLGKTLSLMVEFSPLSFLTSSLIHWIAGIIYLLQIGVYVFGICDVGSQKLLTLKCIQLFVNY